MELCKVTLLLILWVTSCTCQKTDKTADVVVLVDGSSEISATSFQQMKIIINRIIQELEKVSMIGRDIRFGVSQFSDDVQDEVLLKQNFKKNELLRYLKREFVQKQGQRNSSRALEHAHNVLFQEVSGSRRLMGYPQFLVVFIGGKSQDEFRHAVEMVKYLGVKIIAVGIQDYDAAELNFISKQQFIQKQNPQLFQDIVNAIQGELKNPFISGEKPSACKQATADIVFLVDYTDDIGEGNFLQLQKFFYEVFSSFSISKDGVRIGLSMLSETRNAGFHLSQYDSQAEILQHVKDLQYTRGTGRPASTTKSIEELFSQQNGGRAELFVPQIAVFVTNNGSWNDIKEMADKLHSSNVDTFAVGVGVAHEKLSLISSYPPHNFILSADTFLQLASSLQETFIKRLCLFLLGHQLPKNMDVLKDGCVNTEEIDIYFMIDGSGSISGEQFRKIKGFLSQMADIFKVTPEGVRIGVVQYSTDVVTEFPLGQYNSARDLKRAIGDIKQQKKKTFTGKALSHMSRLFLQSASNRPSAQQYLIVLTDGKSDDEVSIPAEELRNMTVHIYAIGVGDAVVSELNEMAGRTDRYFHINNFHFLDDIKEELIEEICLPAAAKHKEADMVFLIHSSIGSSHFKFEQMKEFMEEFLQQFTISEDKVRIAVMQYSDTVQHEFGFDANIGEEAVLNAINAMQPFQGTETKTGLALSSMSDIFRSDSTREYVDKVLIVVTDEKSTDSVEKPAIDLRKEGINIISIGSSNADIEQLVDISGSTESSFYVENYVKVPLESMIFTANVQENDCKSISVADVVFVVDTSSSIDSTEFKTMIDFMLSVVNSSDVGPESVHFGVSLYSDDVQKAFGLEDHLTRESLVKAISDLKQRYGSTYTAKAIKFSKGLLSESQGGPGHQKVPQFLITITDGDSHDHDDLQSVCNTVRASSINTIAVGIDEAIKSELDMIAGSEDNQFYVKTFDKLKNVKNILTKKLCLDKYCPCQEIDVIFLIDGDKKNIKYEKLRQIAGKDSNVFNVRGYEELRRLKRSIIPNICDEEKCKSKKPNDCQIDIAASGLNRQYLRSFGETFALESSNTAQQVILIFTDGLDDDKEILKRESDQLITEGVDGLITVALEGTSGIQDLQSIEFGRGYRYRPQLVIGDKTAGELYTVFDNLAEEKCCDCCKCTGPQGSEGDPGTPGDKGEKGQKGGNGFPGEEGPPGVPGSPGSQGATGDRGCNGQSGLKGRYGYTGEKGDPGEDGWDGISGPEGDEGDPGLKGKKGNEGNPGTPGVPGQPGGKGEKGLTGDPGQPGLDSYTPGEKGETGPTGREGNSGSKGRDGPRGDPGRDGLNGQRGPPGAQGSQGPPGDNGSKGENGSRGKQGPRGKPGEKGLPGDSGIKGPQGAQGPPGGKGSKGGQGPRGQKGQPGDPGVKGDIGSQGFRGQPGFNGRDRYGGKGQKGYKGDRGCQGHQGAQGQIGDKGSDGPKGHKGNRGKSGDGGSKGVTGPPGSPGYDGHRGPKGPPGVPEQTECKLLEYIRKNCGCSDCLNYPLELVVAVDESGGVTSQQWDRMRDLVLRIAREISISESTCPSGARVAVVSYSSRVKRLIEFSDYHTKKKLLELVQREIIRDSSRGSRKMGEAMMYTARHMFKRVRSGKQVKKMAIFMTTGPPADTENLFSAVLELGVSNIIPVIVTSGQVNIDLLSQAFSDCPGRYEVINNYWEPERIINRLNQCFFCYDACNPDPSCKVGDPACLADMPMDVALLLDSSHGMSSAEFEKARDFLYATVDMFSQPCSTRPRAGARLALVQPRQLSSRKEDPVMVEFDFAQFRLNRTGVKQHIKRSLRQLRSTSSLGLAVEYILGNLFQQQQRTKVIFTILGSGSYQQDRRLAEIALKAKCQGYILFTLVLGRRASNTEIGLLSSPPVSYHSCQVGRVTEPDMDYALRHTKYFFSNLQRRKSDYSPSSLPQCQERSDGSGFEDLQRAEGVYQEEKLQATEPEREETARQNGQQEIQPERENTRENEHLPISEPATEQATEPDNKNLTRADINILKNNPEIKPPTLTRCLLNMDYGQTCKGYQAIRWFYNRNTKSCSIFWYGGCGGNGNRFLTKESCLHHCIPQRPVE
ncbi:hypothetical protein AGOR_G00205870 [Albula goreensis]|uniref:Collagen alpha-6(VI) chain n=1 Tax=Albula goreensis TaxID=1534307 RepID=A0A8T3CMJ5_9TELE|nr:hypothetical protein AGOR_G00205870 [Albula goreensis]